MQSVGEATASLGQTAEQMIPVLFDLLIVTPLRLLIGFEA